MRIPSRNRRRGARARWSALRRFSVRGRGPQPAPGQADVLLPSHPSPPQWSACRCQC